MNIYPNYPESEKNTSTMPRIILQEGKKPVVELNGLEKLITIMASFLSAGERWRLLTTLLELIGRGSSKVDGSPNSIIISKNVDLTIGEMKSMFQFFTWLIRVSPDASFSEGLDGWVIQFT